jgi:hypothetical protein
LQHPLFFVRDDPADTMPKGLDQPDGKVTLLGCRDRNLVQQLSILVVATVEQPGIDPLRMARRHHVQFPSDRAGQRDTADERDTGWTEAKVTMDTGKVYTYQFTGRVMGSPDNNLNDVAISKGAKFRVPVKADSERFTLELVNDSPMPSSWQAAEVHWRPTVRAVRTK